jgi:hypothetical protein
MNLEAGSFRSKHPFGLAASGRQVLTFGTLALLKSYTTLLIPNQKRSDKGKHKLFVGCNPSII